MICSNCGSVLAPGAILCGECGTPVSSNGAADYHAGVPVGDTTVVDPVPSAWLPGLSTGRHRRLPAVVDPSASAVRGLIRLTFSTGQHAVVTGTGLVGRQPLPDEGESFRHLLAVPDPSRSMSKTHLEFGFDLEGFWIRDRWSSNGTVLTSRGQPDLPLEAGRRYLAPAGSTVHLSAVTMTVEKAIASSTAGSGRPVVPSG